VRMLGSLKPRRIALATAAATGGVVCAQLSYFQATYVPLKPPSIKSTSGIEIWSGNVDQDGDTNDQPKKPKRVLIIGDSLVVGIGCEEQAVMPQALCKKLSELLQSDIAWISHGINGADIRTIYRDIVHRLQDWRQHQEPQLLRALSRMVPETLVDHNTTVAGLRARLQAAADASEAAVAAAASAAPSLRSRVSGLVHAGEESLLTAAAEGVDIIIVMCGLNDFKRLPAGRTAGAFRRDLDQLLALLQERAGAGCMVALPALPLEETRLPQPLKSAAIWLGARFDAEKRAAAAAEDRRLFIPKPAVDMWRAARERVAAAAAALAQPPPPAGRELVASDGVHPNEAFGEYLAAELAARMRAVERSVAAAAGGVPAEPAASRA
jgi:lysophospholipase L1-like esterase